MSMQHHPFGSGSDPEPIMDINTTPLIDVMLVLLVMLIITIPIQLHAVNLDMPVGTPPPVTLQPEVVRIDIDADDRVRWQGVPLKDRAELIDRLQAASRMAVPPEIHVRPDKQAHYRTFAQVMVSAQQAGLTRLGVVGSEQFARP